MTTRKPAKRTHRRSFGTIRTLRSGRLQAEYVGPDGRKHLAPATFETRGDADAWLSLAQADITRHEWRAPRTVAKARTTFEDYAETWLEGRDLKPRTRAEYRRLLDDFLVPAWGRQAVASITPAEVRAWHARLMPKTPAQRAHTYALLRTILQTAWRDELIAANPCRVEGAGSFKRTKRIKPASLAELEAIAQAMPDRYRALVMVSAWCALRFGEATELRRRDLDLKAGTLTVERAVTRTPGGPFVVGTPKSDAGVRVVNVPPHLLPMLRDHLAEHVRPGRDALLFPSADGETHMATATLARVWYPARETAGREDLRWHDLRHTGAVLAAATGATLAELMARLGHSTSQAAMVYQHAASDRDKAIAVALSKMATAAPVVPISAAAGARRPRKR